MAMISIMKRKPVNTAEAKNHLNELLKEVEHSRKPIIIEKRGEPVAALIDIKTYREKLGGAAPLADEGLLKDLQAFHREIIKERDGLPTGDSVELLRELRQSH